MITSLALNLTDMGNYTRGIMKLSKFFLIIDTAISCLALTEVRLDMREACNCLLS